MSHEPVLVDEVLDFLRIGANEVWVDGTLGGAGHALAVAERAGPGALLIGLDRDPQALERSKVRLDAAGVRARLFHATFDRIPEVLAAAGVARVNGLLLDIGMSSDQIDDAARGFSFRDEEAPLDMRMDPELDLTAAAILNTYREDRLADVFFYFGEVRGARALARRAVEARRRRPFRKVKDLLEIVDKRKGGCSRRGIHPATTVFQALRVAVNDELGQLERMLGFLPEVLAPHAVVAVIAFHSLEDRIVKRGLGRLEKSGAFTVLTPKPLTAGADEKERNPRSRSAKLRAARRAP